MLHNGIDIRAAVGTPLQALDDGEVVKISYTDRGGVGVSIALDSGWTTYHGHLSRVLVDVGDEVETGDVFALSGQSGQVTGPHVHFAIFTADGTPVDPLRLLPRGSWVDA